MEKFKDPRGFSYWITAEKLNRLTATTDTDLDEYIFDVHLIAVENYFHYVSKYFQPYSKELEEILKNLSMGRIEKFFRGISKRVQLAFNKFYKWISGKKKAGEKEMPKNERPAGTQTGEKADIFNQILSFDWEKLKKGNFDFDSNKFEADFKKALTDLTTLTITTKAGKNLEKSMKTEIKLTGDIESEAKIELTDEQLIAYHERMSEMSVNIIKSYAQTFIMLVGVFVPWAGISIPKEALSGITEIVKNVSFPAGSPAAKQG